MVLPQSMDVYNEILPLQDPFDSETLSRKHVQPKNYRMVMCCISSVIIFVLIVALAYTYRSEVGHVGVEQFSVVFIGTRIDNKDADSPGASISGTEDSVLEPEVHVQPENELDLEHEKARSSIDKNLVFTTKDRYGYVRLLADSLNWIKAYEYAHVHIFDDGSTEYSASDLKEWFPYAVVHEVHHGNPDRSTRHAFEWFLQQSDKTVLVNIDSDTMLRPGWNTFIDTHINSSGVLNLYHSNATYHHSVNCNNVTCEKKSTGAMGIVMSRQVIQEMLPNMHDDQFDWGFVKYFKKKNVTIIVPRNSLALHYGMYGAHGAGNHIEVANTFDFSPFPQDIIKRAKEFLNNAKPGK